MAMKCGSDSSFGSKQRATSSVETPESSAPVPLWIRLPHSMTANAQTPTPQETQTADPRACWGRRAWVADWKTGGRSIHAFVRARHGPGPVLCYRRKDILLCLPRGNRLPVVVARPQKVDVGVLAGIFSIGHRFDERPKGQAGAGTLALTRQLFLLRLQPSRESDSGQA